MYEHSPIGTLTLAHVGRSFVTFGSRTICLTDVMGPVQPIDVDKQLFDAGGGVIQVESNEQRDARVANERGLTCQVYRPADPAWPDCSLRGLSSRYHSILVLGIDGPTSLADARELGYPVMRLHAGRTYMHVSPLDAYKVRYAFGGNFVYASDSRFTNMNKYPIPIHDRDMSKERS
jgi:hypothetical protein